MVHSFGKTKEGVEATLYVLRNQNGMEARVSDYGATLVGLWVLDREGVSRDVLLGYDDVSGYECGTVFFGATVGRCANRIGGAAFELGGKAYTLDQNDNGNNLHSGNDFYNKRMWKLTEKTTSGITFVLHSPDGDQGYPGAADIAVNYSLTADNELKIHYMIKAEEDTIVNCTNHSYFNLSGEASGSVLNQQVWINADAYTRADAQSIPTGEITPVSGTPMDFRMEKEIGKEIDAEYEALQFGGGYDHNWVLNESGKRKAASMYSEESGIRMEVYTDLPGMQFYTGNFLENELGKNNTVYKKRYGVCFETQFFPDAINKKQFQSPIVRAGQIFKSETVYQFLLFIRK